jgi:hypothetical protein
VLKSTIHFAWGVISTCNPEDKTRAFLHSPRDFQNYRSSSWYCEKFAVVRQLTGCHDVCVCVCVRGGRVVNTPASYSEGRGIKSRPGDRLIWLRVFVFLSLSTQMPG